MRYKRTLLKPLFFTLFLTALLPTTQAGGIEIPTRHSSTNLLLGGQYNYATYQLPQDDLLGGPAIARSPALAPISQSRKLDDSGLVETGAN